MYIDYDDDDDDDDGEDYVSGDDYNGKLHNRLSSFFFFHQTDSTKLFPPNCDSLNLAGWWITLQLVNYSTNFWSARNT